MATKATATPPAAAEQLRRFEAGVKEKVADGGEYYVVARSWVSRWRAHLEGGGPPPGPVDTGDLCDPARPLCVRRSAPPEDYDLLPAATFDLLAGWYGRAAVQLPRRGVRQADGHCYVEVHAQLVEFRSTAAPAGGQPPWAALLSRRAGPAAVLQLLYGSEPARAALGLDAGLGAEPSNVRLWYTLPAAAPPPPPPSSADSDGSDTDEVVLVEERPGMRPFVRPDTIGDVAANDLQSAVLVEVRRADGSWPRGEIAFETNTNTAAGVDDARWRASVEPGSLVDARDKEDAWFESVVLPRAKGQPPGTLRVHFLGWSSSFDEDIPRASDRLQPLHTHSPKWRYGLRPGDRVEVSTAALVDAVQRRSAAGTDAPPLPPTLAQWFLGAVVSCDHEVQPPEVTVVYPATTWTSIQKLLGAEDYEALVGGGSGVHAGAPLPFTATVPVIGSDWIARLGTHISGAKKLRTCSLAAYPPEGVLGMPVPPLPEAPSYVDAGDDRQCKMIAAVRRVEEEKEEEDDEEEDEEGSAPAPAVGAPAAASSASRALGQVANAVPLGAAPATPTRADDPPAPSASAFSSVSRPVVGGGGGGLLSRLPGGAAPVPVRPPAPVPGRPHAPSPPSKRSSSSSSSSSALVGHTYGTRGAASALDTRDDGADEDADDPAQAREERVAKQYGNFRTSMKHYNNSGSGGYGGYGGGSYSGYGGGSSSSSSSGKKGVVVSLAGDVVWPRRRQHGPWPHAHLALPPPLPYPPPHGDRYALRAGPRQPGQHVLHELDAAVHERRGAAGALLCRVPLPAGRQHVQRAGPAGPDRARVCGAAGGRVEWPVRLRLADARQVHRVQVRAAV
jgi:hypothetical protein